MFSYAKTKAPFMTQNVYMMAPINAAKKTGDAGL